MQRGICRAGATHPSPSTQDPDIRHSTAIATTALTCSLLAGCTSTDPSRAASDAGAVIGEQVVPAPGRTAPARPAPDAQDEDSPSQAPVADSCDDAEVEALATAVQGQLDAIVAGAWEDALAWSTPGFRADIDPESFAAIITDGFPVVAAATSTDLGRCIVATSGDEASMAVTVADADGAEQDLLYLFELDEDGWRIGGALPADGGSSADAGITV